MGGMAYGRKVRQDAAGVSYSYGISPRELEGVLVIPFPDLDSWYVEGKSSTPPEARWVFATAVRLHQQTGRWPDEAPFFS